MNIYELFLILSILLLIMLIILSIKLKKLIKEDEKKYKLEKEKSDIAWEKVMKDLGLEG